MWHRLAVGVFVGMFVASLPVGAQERGYVFGTAGYGSLGDDEGSLGSGRVLGGGGGWQISERLALEVALTKSRHERSGSLSWAGDPLAVTLRAVYRFAAADAIARPFVAAGAGYFRYRGTFTETIFDSPTSAPRTESRDWLVNGRAIEFGGGMAIHLGAALFVRPEAWLTIAGAERARPSPEPPYALPRIAISAGVRF